MASWHSGSTFINRALDYYLTPFGHYEPVLDMATTSMFRDPLSERSKKAVDLVQKITSCVFEGKD